MKKLLVTACILFSSVLAFANDNEDKLVVAKFKVTTNQSNKLANLTFIPSNSEKVTVKILDENGKVIFRENILNKDAFVRPYNLSQLEGSVYTILVIEGDNTYSEKISMSTKEISAVSNVLVAKAIRTEDNKVELKVLQNSANPVYITLKDQLGYVIYNAKVTDKVSFIQKFNITQVAGELTFEVIAGNESEIISL